MKSLSLVLAVMLAASLASAATIKDFSGTIIQESAPFTNAVGPANFATSQATITTTSSGAVLAARPGDIGTGRVSVTVYNLGSATAYLGNSTGVTSSTGLPILPGGSYTKRTTAALYAVTASGSTTLAFDEEF